MSSFNGSSLSVTVVLQQQWVAPQVLERYRQIISMYVYGEISSAKAGRPTKGPTVGTYEDKDEMLVDLLLYG